MTEEIKKTGPVPEPPKKGDIQRPEHEDIELPTLGRPHRQVQLPPLGKPSPQPSR